MLLWFSQWLKDNKWFEHFNPRGSKFLNKPLNPRTKIFLQGQSKVYTKETKRYDLGKSLHVRNPKCYMPQYISCHSLTSVDTLGFAQLCAVALLMPDVFLSFLQAFQYSELRAHNFCTTNYCQNWTEHSGSFINLKTSFSFHSY